MRLLLEFWHPNQPWPLCPTPSSRACPFLTWGSENATSRQLRIQGFNFEASPGREHLSNANSLQYFRKACKLVFAAFATLHHRRYFHKLFNQHKSYSCYQNVTKTLIFTGTKTLMIVDKVKIFLILNCVDMIEYWSNIYIHLLNIIGHSDLFYGDIFYRCHSTNLKLKKIISLFEYLNNSFEPF